MREVDPDIRRNDTLDDRRLFVIIMDDGMAEKDLAAVKSARDAARKFIERLGPSDLAAVIFTKSNQHAQDYTSDKTRLYKAVDGYSIGFRGMSEIAEGPDTNEFYYRSSVRVLQEIAEALIALPQRRKTLVYIGQGVPVNPAATGPVMISPGNMAAVGNAGMHSLLVERTMKVLAAAQRSNVNIYTLDPCGLRVPMSPTCQPGMEQEFLKDLANATGGRAAIDSNDLGPAVEQIFQENASYYLIGFQSTNQRQDGKFRRLEVKVNRPDVEVRARSGYTERDAERAERDAEKEASVPLAKAISGLLPKGDVPLQVWAAPYAIPGQRNANVAITLAVRQTVAARPVARTENVEVSIDVFTNEGRQRSSKAAKASVTLRPGPAGVVGYEILSSLPLAPGRYQLRIGARLVSDGATGSIYYDIDVPDFSRNAVSMSAIALSASPGVTSTRADAMPWLPMRPTTARLFERTDTVTAFARLYQQSASQSSSGRMPAQMMQQGQRQSAVPVHARVVDADGREVWTVNESLDGARFSQGHVDITLAIPVGTLKPGAHMLAIESRNLKQSIRFTVR